jgi:hypothetical protein
MSDRLKSIDSAASTVSMTAGLLESGRLDRVYSRWARVAQLPVSGFPVAESPSDAHTADRDHTTLFRERHCIKVSSEHEPYKPLGSCS